MRLATLPPRTQLLLTIAIPLMSAVIACLLVWPYVAHLREVQQQLQQTQTSIKQKENLINQAKATAEGRDLALAVALPTEQEPVEFLHELANLTNLSSAVLVGARALNTTRLQREENVYGTKPTGEVATPTNTPGQRPVVKESSVRELQYQVTVEGTFSSLLSLLIRLENDARLLSISQYKLRSGGSTPYPQLLAVFTLSRFVATSSMPASTPSAGTAPAEGTPTPRSPTAPAR